MTRIVEPRVGRVRIYERRRLVPKWAVKPLFILFRDGRRCIECEPNWALRLFFTSYLQFGED